MNERVLIIDDEIKMGKALKLALGREKYEVEAAAHPEEGLALLKEQPWDALLCDLKMPGMSGMELLEKARALSPEMPVIMMTAYASAETAVEAMKKGAYDYLIKPFAMDELKILLKRCLKSRELERENTVLRDQLAAPLASDAIVAGSAVMESLLKRAGKVAQSEVTALITGESGTGKELLARAIHGGGTRKDRPFLSVNCGAFSDSLLESELFGHCRGAFTGAQEDRAGIFEAAHGATLFLDEIGEVSPAMQVKLLRVLQSGEIRPLGQSASRQVDVRIIAATNRDLAAMVEKGEFRRDLFYRLHVVPLEIRPLRERREDIPLLLEHFLKKKGGDYRFDSRAQDLLYHYPWPGNVRELENAVDHAVVLAEQETLTPESLPAPIQEYGRAEPAGLDENTLSAMTLEGMEKKMILAAMKHCDNNRTRAARQLGITRRTLGYRLRKYGLDDNLPEEEPEEEELS